MLKVAKRRGRGERGDLVCGDAERMPFRGRSFRSAYSVTVVHEAPGLVGELLRVLAPGVRAVVTLLRKRSEMLSEPGKRALVTRVIDDCSLKDMILVLESPQQ